MDRRGEERFWRRRAMGWGWVREDGHEVLGVLAVKRRGLGTEPGRDE
jgi:hypothetical protein